MAIHSLTPVSSADPGVSTLLAVHPRATHRGSWVIDARHWDGLPEGTGRATTARVPDRDQALLAASQPEQVHPLEALLVGSTATHVIVGHRSLATYDRAAGLPPATGNNGRAVS